VFFLIIMQQKFYLIVAQTSSHAVSDTQDEFKVMGSSLTTKKLVIIHPGSKHLRIGRASDVNPHTILHAIARPRRKDGPLHRDPVLIPTVVLVIFIF
jgi:hypothetical protein